MGLNSSRLTSKTSARNGGSNSLFLLPAILRRMGKRSRPVINIINRRLEKAKGLWADKLPGVLWAYRTTANTSTGETPFSLAYGTEAVIPVECGIPSARYMWLDEDSNRELLNHSLDAIDELRDKAHLRTALYQQKVAQHYNKNIRVRTFKIGDWVLRRVFQNTKEAGAGKLGPN